ncbi:hypothetical protein J2Z72_001522 [Peptostreptococcus canis]|nr:hypothetical protein [Peptostreptococcus canis]
MKKLFASNTLAKKYNHNEEILKKNILYRMIMMFD